MIMEWKYVAIGFVLGVLAGWMRIKQAPTPMTGQAKGF